MIRRPKCVLIKRREDKAAIDRQIETRLPYRKSLIHIYVIGWRRISQEDVRRVTRALTADRASR